MEVEEGQTGGQQNAPAGETTAQRTARILNERSAAKMNEQIEKEKEIAKKVDEILNQHRTENAGKTPPKKDKEEAGGTDPDYRVTPKRGAELQGTYCKEFNNKTVPGAPTADPDSILGKKIADLETHGLASKGCTVVAPNTKP